MATSRIKSRMTCCNASESDKWFFEDYDPVHEAAGRAARIFQESFITHILDNYRPSSNMQCLILISYSSMTSANAWDASLVPPAKALCKHCSLVCLEIYSCVAPLYPVLSKPLFSMYTIAARAQWLARMIPFWATVRYSYVVYTSIKGSVVHYV